jgi:hypothetical protein
MTQSSAFISKTVTEKSVLLTASFTSSCSTSNWLHLCFFFLGFWREIFSYSCVVLQVCLELASRPGWLFLFLLVQNRTSFNSSASQWSWASFSQLCSSMAGVLETVVEGPNSTPLDLDLCIMAFLACFLLSNSCAMMKSKSSEVRASWSGEP